MSDSGDIRAGGAYIEIGARTGGLDIGLQAAASKMEAFSGRIRLAGQQLKALGEMMLNPVREGIRAFEQYGATVGKASARFGLSAQTTGLAQAVSEETGAPMRMVARAFSDLQKGISSQATEWLQSLDLPLEKMKDEYTRLGVIMDETSTKHAREFYEAMHRAELGVRGIYQAIGAALYPVLKPLADRFVDVTMAVQRWINLNPTAIQERGKVAATMTAAGTAIAAVGAGMMAVMSPVFVATAGIVALAAAVGGVSDLLKGSDLGFGDAFNAIRLDGVGLGTWMAAFTLGLENMWIALAEGIATAYDAAMHAIVDNKLLAVLFPQLKLLAEVIPPADHSFAEKRRSEAHDRYDTNKRTMEDLFKADDTGKGTGVDMDRAKAAGKKVVDKFWEFITDALEKMTGKIPHQKWDGGGRWDTVKGDLASLGKMGGHDWAVAGTFSARGANQLAASGSIPKWNKVEEIAKGIGTLARDIAQAINGSLGLAP